MDTVELLMNMIRIPSFSRDEGAVADFLERWMLTEGFEARRLGNNLWMESGPADGRPTILLNAHIDTVRPASGYTRDPFTPEIEDGCLYGLGSNDDGGSLVALLETYSRLIQKEQPYRLIFSATAEEEVSGKGGLDLILPELGLIDFGVMGEPTGMRMAVAERGLMVRTALPTGRAATLPEMRVSTPYTRPSRIFSGSKITVLTGCRISSEPSRCPPRRSMPEPSIMSCRTGVRSWWTCARTECTPIRNFWR